MSYIRDIILAIRGIDRIFYSKERMINIVREYCEEGKIHWKFYPGILHLIDVYYPEQNNKE